MKVAKKIKHLMILSIAQGLLWLPPLTQAAATQTYVACSLPLPPHTMPNEQGQPTGYATEILHAVARHAGWTISIRYMPWIRVVDEAKRGECDLVYTVLQRADYAEFLNYPKHPLQLRPNVLIVKRDSGIQYDGDLEKFMSRYSIGLYRDKAVDDNFEKLRSAEWARIDHATDAHHNLLKLLAGRFDAAIENEQTAIHTLTALGRQQDVVILQPPLNVMSAYVAFPKAGRLADQANVFDAAIEALHLGADTSLGPRKR